MNTCIGPECQRPVHVKKFSLCTAHYSQQYRGIDLYPLPHREHPECAVTACAKEAVGRGLCGPHASIASRFKVETPDFVRLLEERWCYSCQARISDSKRVAFDHDHGCCPTNNTCGQCLRGTLCTSCNATLGKVRDKPEEGSKYDLYLKGAPHFVTAPWKARYKVQWTDHAPLSHDSLRATAL